MEENFEHILKRIERLERKIDVLIQPKGQLRERLLTVDDVMVILGIRSRTTVYKYVQQLGGIKMPGGWRFKRELVERFGEGKNGKGKKSL